MQFETIQPGSAFDENFLSLVGPANLATPHAGGYIVGQFYDNAPHCTATGVLAGVADRTDIAPFSVNRDLKIDRFGVACSTQVASAEVKVFVYDSGANSWPDSLLYVSEALDLSSQGAKLATLNFTFLRGRLYWLGVWHSSTAAIRVIPVANAYNLGINGEAGTNYFTRISRSLDYSDAEVELPAKWIFNPAELVANVSVPSFRMRAA